MRPSSLLAVAASAVLGVALGIGGGFALDRGPSSFADPLALGVPFHNQPCGAGVLFTVGRGGVGQLGAALTENADLHVQYLATRHSCPTRWTLNDAPPPPYVAYVGPFGSRRAACDAQFTAGHHGGIVTILDAGTTDSVQCLCYVSLPAPTLRNGVDTEGTDGIWLRQLQNLLIDMGRATQADATGSYDVTTATEIRDFQRDRGLPATGVVDDATWAELRGQGCKLYKS